MRDRVETELDHFLFSGAGDWKLPVFCITLGIGLCVGLVLLMAWYGG